MESDLLDSSLFSSQSATSLQPNSQLFITDDDGTEYELFHPLPSRYRRTDQSIAWQHGVRLNLRGTRKEQADFWRCDRCRKVMTLKNGTRNIVRHLRDIHQITDEETQSRNSSPAPSSSVSNNRPMRQLTLNETRLDFPDISQFRVATVSWLLASAQPFSIVDNVWFRRVLRVVQPQIDPYLFSQNTAKTWSMLAFANAKKQVKSLLQRSLTRIHITVDIWTSKYNSYSFLGICAHFVTEDSGEWKLKNVILSLKRLRKKHTGEFQASIVLSGLQEYDIVENIGVIVADNAPDNDTLVKHLWAEIDPLAKLEGKRGRCMAHIINLVAKSYLYKNDVEAFTAEADRLGDNQFDPENFKKAHALWQKKGPIGKLHNLVVFIKSSTSREEEFKAIKTGDHIDGTFLL